MDLIPKWLPNGNDKKISGTWLKQIEIHLEHENKALSSWQELLQLLVVPGKELNVLVTYPDKSDEDTVKKAYESILKDIDVTTPLLVIFGYSDDNGKTIDWKGFVYNKLTKKFEEIVKKA